MAGPRPADTRLAQTFVELTDSLVEDFDVVDLMVLLTERCVELLDTAAAGLLLADSDGTLHLMAATSEATEAVELFQIQSDEGPCRDCFHLGRSVTTLNLEDENVRWPRFAPVAAAAGFRAAHAFPLRLRGRVLGAMNLFRTEPFALERIGHRHGPGSRRRRHDRRPAEQERQRRPDGGGSHAGGPADEDHHRAGQGHRRPESRRNAGSGVRPASPLRAKQLHAAGGGRPAGRGRLAGAGRVGDPGPLWVV